MIVGLMLCLHVLLLQAVLIHYQHFSTFERESNLRAVLWGGRPAWRYWAVLLLDLGTGLLLALLVLGVLPKTAQEEPSIRLLRFLPAWVVVSLVAGLFNRQVSNALIRFPNYALMVRKGVVGLLYGVIGVAATLLAISHVISDRWQEALAAWSSDLPATLPLAVFLALAVFVPRAGAFLLRVIPFAGGPLHAGVYTGGLLWLMYIYGQMLGSGPPAGYTGQEGVALGLGILTAALAVVVWRLAPARPSDGVAPPPLVVGSPETVQPRIAVAAGEATLSSAKVTVHLDRDPFRFRVVDAQGELLLACAPNGLTRALVLQRTVAIPLLYTGNTFKLKKRVGGRTVGPVRQISADGASMLVTFDRAVLRLRFQTEEVLHIQFSHRSRVLPHVSVDLWHTSDTHALGLGQRFNKCDQRGEDAYFLVEEGGVGYGKAAPLLKRFFGARGTWPNGEQCTGFPVPFALFAREQGSTAGLFWSTYRPSWLSVAKPNRKMATVDPSAACVDGRRSLLTVLDRHLDLYICTGPSPLATIQQYTGLTGRSKPPPPWALLPWKTRTGPVTEDDTLEDIREFRRLQIPLAHVGIEHWQEVRGSYEFSRQWYPHIDDLVATAREHGMRITAWHFPYMNAGSATHREGVRKGFFLRNRLGLPYQQRIFHGIATVIDYTNPRAAAWHENIVKRAFYRRGFQGAMTDYAESVPPDCLFYNGQSGLTMRNAYPVMYVQSMQRAAAQVLDDDHIIYPRAGYAGSQRFVTLQWPGDQDTDWDDGDGLPAAVRAMLNLSICGFPVHGSDIGGWYDWYTPITTKELFIRWAEVGAYSPLMRAHGGPVGRNREPWKFDEETVAIYRALSEEHVKLFPHLYSLSIEAHKTGLPIVRHPALVWPERAELYEIEDAWLVGEALYVAPIIRPGQREREIVLPPGDWWDLNAGKAVQGPARIAVDAPLGVTPRFLRRGFILPRFAQDFDTFDFGTKARVGRLDGDLEVWLYPAEDTAPFRLFDGTTLEPGRQTTGARRVAWRLFGR